MTSDPTHDDPGTGPVAAAGGAPGPLPLAGRVAARENWRRGHRRAWPHALLSCLLVLLACLTMTMAMAPPAAAAPEKTGGDAATAPSAPSYGPNDPQDPVVAQVLEMLRGGITEPVIVAWLDKSGQRPAAVSSSDMVALHKAGASDDLLKRLVELATGVKQPAAAPAPAGAAAGGAAAPAPPAAAARPTTTALPAPAPAPAAPAAAGTPAAAPAPAAVKVRYAVTYRPVTVDEDQPWSEPWQLVLYVDGHFIAAAKPGPALLPLPPRTFDRALAPGKHLLRLVRERHAPYRRATGYVSPARVDPSEFPFELQPGAADQVAQISIHFGEKSFKHPGPIAFRVVQGGRDVVRLEPAAPGPEAWPALCEDIPTALPAGAKLPSDAQKDLKSCVQWAALWPGLGAVPARDQVRIEMEQASRAPDL